MELTEKNKEYIDGLDYFRLLHRNRFAPIGDPWFQGETGEYWLKRMRELRALPGGDELHTECSKQMRWD